MNRKMIAQIFLPAMCAGMAVAQENAGDLATARRMMAAGQIPQAIAAYRGYLAKYPSESGELELAEAYRRVHNFEAARKLLLQAQRQHPKSAGVLKALGNLELEAQSYDAAVTAFRKALAITPQDLELRNFLGSAYQGKNDPAAALVAFNYVIAHDAKNQLAHYLRAQIYADEGENQKAIPDAQMVVDERPGYLPGRVLLAKIQVRLKQCKEAVENLRAAHEGHELDSQGLFVLANAYECDGAAGAKEVREEFAAAAAAEHQRQENEVQSKHLVEQANELARKNQFAEAMGLLEEALTQNPENAFAYSQKAKILFSLGDRKEAKEAILRAVELQPYQPDFLYVKGVILEHEENLDEALGIFQEVTEINPREADAYFEIGKIRLQQGYKDAARAAFRKAAELDPGEPEYRKAAEGIE
jgi:tetratricopeptide (TPR) repeat protein